MLKFRAAKFICKWRPQNGGHFVQTSGCWWRTFCLSVDSCGPLRRKWTNFQDKETSTLKVRGNSLTSIAIRARITHCTHMKWCNYSSMPPPLKWCNYSPMSPSTWNDVITHPCPPLKWCNYSPMSPSTWNDVITHPCPTPTWNDVITHPCPTPTWNDVITHPCPNCGRSLLVLGHAWVITTKQKSIYGWNYSSMF